MPRNLRTQKCCNNCTHCIRIREWEQPVALFCGFSAPDRPKCGSHLMDEQFPSLSEEEHNGVIGVDDAFEKANDVWLKWTEGRVVDAQQICDDYKVWMGNDLTREASKLTMKNCFERVNAGEEASPAMIADEASRILDDSALS